MSTSLSETDPAPKKIGRPPNNGAAPKKAASKKAAPKKGAPRAPAPPLSQGAMPATPKEPATMIVRPAAPVGATAILDSLLRREADLIAEGTQHAGRLAECRRSIQSARIVIGTRDKGARPKTSPKKAAGKKAPAKKAAAAIAA
jgi:hypothetical protein